MAPASIFCASLFSDVLDCMHLHVHLASSAAPGGCMRPGSVQSVESSSFDKHALNEGRRHFVMMCVLMMALYCVRMLWV